MTLDFREKTALRLQEMMRDLNKTILIQDFIPQKTRVQNVCDL